MAGTKTIPAQQETREQDSSSNKRELFVLIIKYFLFQNNEPSSNRLGMVNDFIGSLNLLSAAANITLTQHFFSEKKCIYSFYPGARPLRM